MTAVRANIKRKGQGYPYMWLDEIIDVTLNPEKTNVSQLKEQQLKMIEEKFDQELQGVLEELKESTFFLFSDKKVKATVAHYYESLLLLEQQAKINLAAYPANHPLAATGESLLVDIEDIAKAFKTRYEKYLPEINSIASKKTVKERLLVKILCKLSVDQIGILLKAADDNKVIIANSLSLIFRSIVPYLSTEKTKTISWNSMRKSTYNMEQSDKDFVIAVLENLIVRIKKY